LLIRLPDLSTWAVLLVFFWPIADTFFAIYRRRRAGRPTDMPDRLHYHQLVMRALEITLIGRNRRNVANPLATLVILPLASAPVIAGVLLWNKPLEVSTAETKPATWRRKSRPMAGHQAPWRVRSPDSRRVPWRIGPEGQFCKV